MDLPCGIDKRTVSNAGGLGTITALTFPDPEELGGEIRKTRQMTGNTFAVNVTLLPSFRPVNYDEYLDIIIGEGITNERLVM